MTKKSRQQLAFEEARDGNYDFEDINHVFLSAEEKKLTDAMAEHAREVFARLPQEYLPPDVLQEHNLSLTGRLLRRHVILVRKFGEVTKNQERLSEIFMQSLMAMYGEIFGLAVNNPNSSERLPAIILRYQGLVSSSFAALRSVSVDLNLPSEDWEPGNYDMLRIAHGYYHESAPADESDAYDRVATAFYNYHFTYPAPASEELFEFYHQSRLELINDVRKNMEQYVNMVEENEALEGNWNKQGMTIKEVLLPEEQARLDDMRGAIRYVLLEQIQEEAENDNVEASNDNQERDAEEDQEVGNGD